MMNNSLQRSTLAFLDGERASVRPRHRRHHWSCPLQAADASSSALRAPAGHMSPAALVLTLLAETQLGSLRWRRSRCEEPVASSQPVLKRPLLVLPTAKPRSTNRETRCGPTLQQIPAKLSKRFETTRQSLPASLSGRRLEASCSVFQTEFRRLGVIASLVQVHYYLSGSSPSLAIRRPPRDFEYGIQV